MSVRRRAYIDDNYEPTSRAILRLTLLRTGAVTLCRDIIQGVNYFVAARTRALYLCERPNYIYSARSCGIYGWTVFVCSLAEIFLSTLFQKG